MLAVVIPTRNRKLELNSLLNRLDKINTAINQVIVIDSSDNQIDLNHNYVNIKIEYYHTNIKSAAIQRNIGMSKVNDKSKYLAFLDDDVLPDPDYFKQLISVLNKKGAIGVSGLAVSTTNTSNRKSHGLAFNLKRIFMLDSKKGGNVLRSGVNIPVIKNRNINGAIHAYWLIGCALWDFQKIRNIRFDHRFYGQSLGEDVLFSLQASKLGNLFVDTETILSHSESLINRPNYFTFNRMWVRNRYYIVKKLSNRKFYPGFHWCNLGKTIILVISVFRYPKRSITSLLGMAVGIYDLVVGKNDN